MPPRRISQPFGKPTFQTTCANPHSFIHSPYEKTRLQLCCRQPERRPRALHLGISGLQPHDRHGATLQTLRLIQFHHCLGGKAPACSGERTGAATNARQFTLPGVSLPSTAVRFPPCKKVGHLRRVAPPCFSPHISRSEICAASKLFLQNDLARPTGKNGKTKVVFPFFDGVSPDRPDSIRPYRPTGRILHAMHEIFGLTDSPDESPNSENVQRPSTGSRQKNCRDPFRTAENCKTTP